MSSPRPPPKIGDGSTETTPRTTSTHHRGLTGSFRIFMKARRWTLLSTILVIGTSTSSTSSNSTSPTLAPETLLRTATQHKGVTRAEMPISDSGRGSADRKQSAERVSQLPQNTSHHHSTATHTRDGSWLRLSIDRPIQLNFYYQVPNSECCKPRISLSARPAGVAYYTRRQRLLTTPLPEALRDRLW